MRAREFAATVLAAAIADRVQLGSRPTVLEAAPSQVVEYPTIAVQIEDTDDVLTTPGFLLADEAGNLITGSGATDDAGNIIDGDPIVLGNGTTLSNIGTSRCRGAIWVGARYPAKRSEIEEAIWFAFNQDDSSPGRLILPLNGYRVGDLVINVGSVAAADIAGSHWTPEHAWEARIWSYNRFTMDFALIIPRNDPIATKLILEFSRDITTAVEQPSDVAKLLDLEKYKIVDGEPIPTTT